MTADPQQTAAGPGRVGTTSSRLLQRLKIQDASSWQRLIDLYGPLVYHWCRSYGLRAQDAADVFQEVFAAVWSGIGGFKHEPHRGRFRGWLWTIAHNKISNHYRDDIARPDAPGANQDMLAQLAIPEQLPDEDSDSLHRRETKAVFRRAVEAVRAEFGNRTWEAFWRVTVEKQRSSEVATALGLSRNGVRQAKSRVLRRLREEMGDLLL